MDDRNVFINEMERQVRERINARFPIVNDKYSLSIENIRFTRPKEATIPQELELKRAQGTLSGKVFGDLVLKDKNNEIIQQKPVKILDLPYPSLRGTFIINGNEKVVQNQNVSKGGIYVSSKGNLGAKTDIRLQNYSGPKLSLEVDEKTLSVTVGNRNFNGIKFLEALGFASSEIDEMIGGDSFGRQVRNNRSGGGQGTIDELYDLTAKRGGYIAKTADGKAQAIRDYFTKGIALTDEERETASATLSMRSVDSFNLDAIKASVKHMVGVARGEEVEDDRDDLLFQNVKNPIDLIADTIDEGLISFANSAKNTMSPKKADIKFVTPALTKVNNHLNTDFFKKDSRVSDTDQINPLLVLTEENTVMSTGKGGIILAIAEELGLPVKYIPITPGLPKS